MTAAEHAGVVRWLKANLALSTAALAILSAAAGGLVSATLAYAHMTAREAQLEAQLTQLDSHLSQVMGDYTAVDKRVSLLEAQLTWAANRIGHR